LQTHIGLDVHQATIYVAILDSAGKLVMVVFPCRTQPVERSYPFKLAARLAWCAEMQAQVVQTVSTVSMEQVPSKLAVGRQFANDPGNVVVANRVRGLLREAPRNQEGHELYDEIDDDLRTGS